VHLSNVLVSEGGGNGSSADVISKITCGGTEQASWLYTFVILMSTDVEEPHMGMQVTHPEVQGVFTVVCEHWTLNWYYTVYKSLILGYE